MAMVPQLGESMIRWVMKIQKKQSRGHLNPTFPVKIQPCKYLFYYRAFYWQLTVDSVTELYAMGDVPNIVDVIDKDPI